MKTIRHFNTLFYYDGPQVFEARDADGRPYVAVLVDADSIGGERYLVTGVAPERLGLFRSGGLDLKSLLVESDREERYVATADAGIDQPLQLEKLTEPLEDCGLLPDSGFLLHERFMNIDGQIEELKLVEDGWLEGRGRVPSRAGLDWLRGVFVRHVPDDVPHPYLYPTETGGVQAEWSLGSREATLEVNLETHDGQWHVLDLESKDVQERTFNCDSDDDWAWLIGQIKRYESSRLRQATT